MDHFLLSNQIHETWYELFNEHKDLVNNINNKIQTERKTKIVYPPDADIYKVFRTNINNIKFVLLGQDPYVKEHQAMGLSFSVNKDVEIPPSLKNIFMQLRCDFRERNYRFRHGDLSKWAENGVFLLNSALTVVKDKPNSHQCIWKIFTDHVIGYINKKNAFCIYLLFGQDAQEKAQLIQDQSKIIKRSHPSPYSANVNFLNTHVFVEAEEKLGREFDWGN